MRGIDLQTVPELLGQEINRGEAGISESERLRASLPCRNRPPGKSTSGIDTLAICL